MTFSRWGRNSARKRQNSLLFTAMLVVLVGSLVLANVSSGRVLAQNATPTPNPFTDVTGQIIFRQNDALSSINLDGMPSQPLSLDAGFTPMCPVWSHDGQQMAAIGGSTEFGLYVFAATGG